MDYSFEEKGCAFLKAVHSRESIEKFNADVRDFIQTNKISNVCIKFFNIFSRMNGF